MNIKQAVVSVGWAGGAGRQGPPEDNDLRLNIWAKQNRALRTCDSCVSQGKAERSGLSGQEWKLSRKRLWRAL